MVVGRWRRLAFGVRSTISCVCFCLTARRHYGTLFNNWGWLNMTLMQQVKLSSLLFLPRSSPTGIVFARTNGVNLPFSEPRVLGGIVSPPQSAGVYVIVVRAESWGPRRFRPIYFGKAGDFPSRVNPSSHEHYDEWCDVAGGAVHVYASFCELPRCSRRTLFAVEGGLIDYYKPECNVAGKALGIFARAASRANPHVFPLRQSGNLASMVASWQRSSILK